MGGFSAVTYALCKKYTNGAIQTVVESFSEGMHFKGSVPNKEALPANPEKGDLYIIVDTGTKVVYDGEQWVEFEQNFYTKTEVEARLREIEEEIPSIDHLATKAALLEEINRAKSREDEIEAAIPTKTSQLSNDSGFLVSQDIEHKADKSYVDDQLELKQDKLTPGDHINIINNVISADVPSLDGYATEQWVEDKHYLTEHQSLDNYYVKSEVNELLDGKQDELTPGENITIVDNVISAVGGSSGTFGRDFVTDITVGHLKLGTKIKSSDKISDILYKMLCTPSDEKIMIYYGATDDIPVSIEGLSFIEKNISELLNNGLVQNIKTGNELLGEGQYPVIAAERKDGTDIKLSKWSAQGAESVPIPFLTIEGPDNLIYYIGTKTYDIDIGGTNYILTFVEE